MSHPSIKDMLYSLCHSLRLIVDAIDEFFQRLPRPILTFAGFFCLGLFTVSSMGLLLFFMPVMSPWQGLVAYVAWAATLGTVLLHWDC